MRIVGWLASAAGLIGVVVFNGLAPLTWVVRRDLRGRARDLLAIPDMGLEAAGALTGAATGWLGEASEGIANIRTKADELVRAPVIDAAAATDLAMAVDAFATGPYAQLRALYAGLRERALAAGDAIRGIGRAVPVLAVAGVVADRLEEIDARLLEIDATVTSLAALGPAGLAEPGVAATVSERAAAAQERIEAIGASVAEIDAWLEFESRAGRRGRPEERHPPDRRGGHRDRRVPVRLLAQRAAVPAGPPLEQPFALTSPGRGSSRSVGTRLFGSSPSARSPRAAGEDRFRGCGTQVRLPDPRTRLVAIPMQQIAAATANASWIAAVSAALAWAAGVPALPLARCTGSRVATIAALSAIPSACPTTRIWARVPTRCRPARRGTEPSTALLLGLMNRPCPSPSRTSRQSRSPSVKSAGSWVRLSSARVMIAMPALARTLGPKRSDAAR